MHPNERLLRDEYEARAHGDDAALVRTFAEVVVWHVPGRNAVSGTYRGPDEVLDYVHRRRRLVDDSFEITVHDVLANDLHGLVIASGRAVRDGEVLEWRAHGLYRFEDGKIAECWVLPEDMEAFDHIWQ